MQRTVYGESLDPNGPSNDPTNPSVAQSSNLRGQPLLVFDGAGVVRTEAVDFKGNLLRAHRRLATTYIETPHWTALSDTADPTGLDSDAITAGLLDSDEAFTSESTYDALNRVVTATSPIAVTVPNRTPSITRYVYNEANLLDALHVSVNGAGEQPVISNIEYNARGQRLSCVRDNGTTVTYDYDPKTFRVTTITAVRSGPTPNRLQALTYTYDAVGNITELSDDADWEIYFNVSPTDGTGRYEYDALYRLVKAQGREHPGQTQDTNDPNRSLPHPNDLQRLTRYTEEYEYDAAGNIKRMQHTPNSGDGWTRRYLYAYEITGEEPSNRLRRSSEPGDDLGVYSTEYRYQNDANNNAGAHGSITWMPSLPGGIGWNHADQMQRAGKLGGGNVYFTYDAAGQRVRKVWDRGNGLVEERIYLGGFEIFRRHQDAALTVERETLHLADDQERVAMVETKTKDEENSEPGPTGESRWRYQLNNHLGTSTVETDSSSRVISYEEYHPYGTTAFYTGRALAEVSTKRYRYTGKERDEETGLYYHGARYYAPWLGRWTAADPAGLVDGLNLYRYSRDNPVRFSDPGGTQAVVTELDTAMPREFDAQEAAGILRVDLSDLNLSAFPLPVTLGLTSTAPELPNVNSPEAGRAAYDAARNAGTTTGVSQLASLLGELVGEILPALSSQGPSSASPPGAQVPSITMLAPDSESASDFSFRASDFDALPPQLRLQPELSTEPQPDFLFIPIPDVQLNRLRTADDVLELLTPRSKALEFLLGKKLSSLTDLLKDEVLLSKDIGGGSEVKPDEQRPRPNASLPPGETRPHVGPEASSGPEELQIKSGVEAAVKVSPDFRFRGIEKVKPKVPTDKLKKE